MDANGISEAETQKAIKIFPNPATTELQLSRNFTGTNTIMILDNIGKKVLVKEWKYLELLIDISQYAEGVYTIVIIGDHFIGNSKFVKVAE